MINSDMDSDDLSDEEFIDGYLVLNSETIPHPEESNPASFLNFKFIPFSTKDETTSCDNLIQAIQLFVTAQHYEPDQARRNSACWLPIRPCDRESRNEWCLPGGVFGVYPDGVGRLLPLPDRLSIAVYSVAPDIVDPHPDEAHPEDYVQVVKVCHDMIFALPDSSLFGFVSLISLLVSLRRVKLQ
jgi:hypothetical protein